MEAQELAQTQENSQGASGEAPLNQVKYEIGVEWKWKKVKVKAKLVEGESRWDTVNVLDAVAALLQKYRHNIPPIRNRLVPSWVVSLSDSHECAGTLEVTLTPYKDNLSIYIVEIKDNVGEAWMVKSVNVILTCATSKYSHDIQLYFDHNVIIDKYDDKECSGECAESSLPTQVKVNKLYEMLVTLSWAIPLIGWYTGKVTVTSED
jgi:hypothetical protein